MVTASAPAGRPSQDDSAGAVYATVDGPVATLVLNRPAVLNCADDEYASDLDTLIDRLRADAAIRVVVIRGAGRAFCSGIDLTALSEGRIGAPFFRRWEDALRKLETMDAMVIAAIHSHCIGGGLQLALACDLRIARQDARFGLTAVKEGIIPGLGMWRVARYAGLGRAKRLALLAEVVDAPTALAWGLVDQVTSADTFDPAVAAAVERALAMTRTSTRLTKKLIDMAIDAPFGDIVDVFCEFQQLSTTSAEHRTAMSERRAARRATGRTVRD